MTTVSHHIRLSEETVELLRQIGEKDDLTQAAEMTMLIRVRARQHGLLPQLISADVKQDIAQARIDFKAMPTAASGQFGRRHAAPKPVGKTKGVKES
jgi:hypothetical protein